MDTTLTLLLKASNQTNTALSQFQRDLDAGKKSLSMMGDIAKKVGVYIASFVSVNAIGNAISSMQRLTRETAEAVEQTDRLAQAIGLTAEKMSALQFSGRMNDVDDLTSSMKAFTKAIAESADESSKASRTFAAMGIDTANGTRSVAELLGEVADRFEGYRDGARKAALAQELFGRSSMDLIGWLNQGSEGLRKDAERAQAFGLIIDQDLVQKSKRLGDAWKMIGEMVTGFGNALVRTAGPAMATVIEFLTGIEQPREAFQNLAQSVEWIFTKTIQVIGTLIMTIITGIENITDRLTGLIIAIGMGFQGKTDEAQEFLKGWNAQIEENTKQLERSISRLWKGYSEFNVILKAGIASKTAKQEAPLIPADRAGRAGFDRSGFAIENAEPIKQARPIAEAALADPNNYFAQLQLKMEETAAAWGTMAQQMASTTVNMVTGAVQGLSNAMTALIMGTKTAAAAFSEFAISMATNFIQSILQMILWAKVALPILTALGVLSGGATAATGAAVTNAALISTIATAGAIAARAEGGIIPGAPSSKDNRLAMVATGEYVVQAAAVQRYGAGLFEALNRMQVGPSALAGMRFERPPMSRSSSFATGGFVAGGVGQSVNVMPAPVQIAILNSKQELADFLRSRSGQKVIADSITGRKIDLGLRS